MGLLPDPPVIVIPANSGKVTRAALRADVNVVLKKRDQPALPVEGSDFEDVTNPLRIEIEALLERVAPGTKSRAAVEKRNADRVRVVQEYLELNYPNNPSLRRMVLNDLMSYQTWEKMPKEDSAEARAASIRHN